MKKKKAEPPADVAETEPIAEKAGKQTSRASEKEPQGKAAKGKEQPPAQEEEGLQQRLLRLQADFDNFRKRTLRERGEVSQRANEDLLEELLPVLDHFELGLNTARQHKSDAAVMDGFQLVYDQFMSALKKFGLSPIDAEGKAFDPHMHEAATHMPSEEHPEDMVIAQTRRGYKLGVKLLRPAQVVVSSGPMTGADAADEAGGQEEEI